MITAQSLITLFRQALSERISKTDWMPSSGYDVEPYFRTVLYEEVSPAFLMMVLSFPALRFY